MTSPKLTKKDYDFYKMKAYFLARQLAPRYPFDELVGWGMVSLAKSLIRYVPDSKMSLHNYIIQNMKWDMIDAIRSMHLENRDEVKKGITYSEVSLDDIEEIPDYPNVDTDVLDLQKAVVQLSTRRRQYIEAYLKFDDREKAAKSIGISHVRGHHHYWQAIRTLRTILTRDVATIET